MEIIGISNATTYGSGVTFEVETKHMIAGTVYIIAWGFSPCNWHVFRGIRKASEGYNSYESYEQIEHRFKSKRKGREYLSYLDRILSQIQKTTYLDETLSLFDEQDVDLYQDEIERLVRKLINQGAAISNSKKNKIINIRKAYLKREYQGVEAWILMKMLQ